MSQADMQRHADHFLRVATRHPQCTSGALLEVTESGAVLALDLDVAMPTAFRADGHSPNGVRNVERVQATLPASYPWKSPAFSLRADFPRNLPHLAPGSAHVLPSPCLVDGSIDEFFNQHGMVEFAILFIVEQMCIWLGRAAVGSLSNPQDGWEPVLRQGLSHTLIANTAFVRGELRQQAGSVCLETNFVRSGAVGVPLDQSEAFLVSFNSFAAIVQGLRPLPFEAETLQNGSHIGKTVTIVCWPAADHINDEILPETISNLDELTARAHALGCGAPFEAFLGQLGRRLQSKALPVGFPIGVILCARRPYRLMGRNSDIELLPYMFEIYPVRGRTSLFQGASAQQVETARLLEMTTPALLRELSASPELGTFSLIGCGSVGSKVAMHLARAGGEILAVTDNGMLLPHNMARHALARSPVPSPKAFELARELSELGQNSQTGTGDAMKALRNPKDRLALAPAGTSVLLNTTASLLLRDALSLQSPADMPARMAELALFGRGRGAFLFFEGLDRNPTVTDLLAALSAEATPAECALLFDSSNGLVQVQIGEGCGSLTMPMTDARLSAMTAAATEELMRLATSMPAAGEIVLGIQDAAGPSTNWRRITIASFIEVPVEGGDWTLRVSPKVETAIRQDVALYPNVETGGLLIGTCNSRTKTITVVDTLPAPADSRRTAGLFVLGTEGLGRATRKRHRDSGGSLIDVGTWHSHLTNQGPSLIDRRTAQDMAAQRPPPAVLLIALPEGYCSIVHRRPE